VTCILILIVLTLGYRQYQLTDRTEELNAAIKTLAGGLIDVRMRCDVAGERTDELWVEVFNDEP
jgi:hypothetical protein